MNWVERTLWVGVGVLLALVAFWIFGSLTVAGDFAANVSGAAIGGMISVGLAILMYQHERKVSAKDTANSLEHQRSEAIREALRYVRAIRGCIVGGNQITINTSERITRSLNKARELAVRALDDPALTDFSLRLAMEDAATIASDTVARLNHDLQQAALQEANQPAPNALDISDSAIRALDELIAGYTNLRRLPRLEPE